MHTFYSQPDVKYWWLLILFPSEFIGPNNSLQNLSSGFKSNWGLELKAQFCLLHTKYVCGALLSSENTITVKFIIIILLGSCHQMLQRRIPTSHVPLRNFLFFINSRPLCASGELYYHFSFSNKIPLLPVRGLFSVNISSHPSKQTLCIFRAIWKRWSVLSKERKY